MRDIKRASDDWWALPETGFLTWGRMNVCNYIPDVISLSQDKYTMLSSHTYYCDAACIVALDVALPRSSGVSPRHNSNRNYLFTVYI